MSVLNGSLAHFRGGRRGFFGDDFLASPASGVVAGTYGDGTHVGQFTVNTAGDITAASNVLITGASPTGAAGGALSGTYPNPQFAVQTQLLNMGGNKVTGVADGSANNDAVNVEQLYAAKGLIYFTVSNTTIADSNNVQYSNAGSGNITQSSGIVTITNPSNFTQAFSLSFSIYGTNTGQTSTFYMMDATGSNFFGAADDAINGGANSINRIVAYVQVAANSSQTLRIFYHTSGGTYTVATTGQGGLNVRNAFQVMQVY